ncbi:MAG: SufE [Waddliaceae bacterium]|nr:SufE [Waddliaceae bacterium]
MFESCLTKQNELIELFAECRNAEDTYQKIMDLGKSLPDLEQTWKTENYRVQGCQSLMYLHSYLNENGKVIFEGYSDALISSGLAAIMIKVYSEESPETILQCEPEFLDKLGIRTSLSPNRANGLASLHLRMKQEALRLMIESQSSGT